MIDINDLKVLKEGLEYNIKVYYKTLGYEAKSDCGRGAGYRASVIQLLDYYLQNRVGLTPDEIKMHQLTIDKGAFNADLKDLSVEELNEHVMGCFIIKHPGHGTVAVNDQLTSGDKKAVGTIVDQRWLDNPPPREKEKFERGEAGNWDKLFQEGFNQACKDFNALTQQLGLYPLQRDEIKDNVAPQVVAERTSVKNAMQEAKKKTASFRM